MTADAPWELRTRFAGPSPMPILGPWSVARVSVRGRPVQVAAAMPAEIAP